MDTGDVPTPAALRPMAIRCLVLLTGGRPTNTSGRPADTVSLPAGIGCSVLTTGGLPADTGCLVLTTGDAPMDAVYQPG